MNLRAILAILLCKFLRFVSRVLHRGGTAMPGRFALKVCPNLLSILSRDVKTVAITGTNGKTTSSRMVEQAFADAGLSYFANRSGANLISGITTEFVMNSTLGGKPKKEYAVIECDEGNFPAVAAALQPRAVIVTNLFRDQLDRYGEVTHTRDLIASGIQKAPGAVLCLNADCSLTASLGWDVPNKTVYFGLENISSDAVPSVSSSEYESDCICEKSALLTLAEKPQAVFAAKYCAVIVEQSPTTPSITRSPHIFAIYGLSAFAIPISIILLTTSGTQSSKIASRALNIGPSMHSFP